MKAEAFDKAFDNGESIVEHLDFSKATRPGRVQRRINVDFPEWMIQSLDKEAERLGIPRQAVIKVWISDRIRENEAIYDAD
ncbi:MAG: type II toxin-antitoxin system BrnA family antitoxin [Kiritimatiellia bacterium]